MMDGVIYLREDDFVESQDGKYSDYVIDLCCPCLAMRKNIIKNTYEIFYFKDLNVKNIYNFKVDIGKKGDVICNGSLSFICNKANLISEEIIVKTI